MEPDRPSSEWRARVGRKVRTLLRVGLACLSVVVVIVVLYLASRIVLYGQSDDELHLALKRTYLESLPELAATRETGPNLVVILFDDLGPGDLGAYGGQSIATPNLDRLAQEGRKFTSFMVASPVCTPSRAALLTGCYPKRVGMHQHVLFPQSTKGLNPEEHTIADHLRSQGYATACFG